MAPELAQLERGTSLAGAAGEGSPGDLEDLLRTFNDVTSKLQRTHETLRAEVSRLQGELEQANRRLRRSRELAALGEMAAGIAHEIRNPLGSIKLYTEALEADLRGDEASHGTAVKIGSAVEGLDRIVGDVLAFAREMRLRPDAHGAGDLLAAAAEEVRHDAERQGVAVEIEAGAGLDAACDGDLMRRALVNLARNAVEAAGLERGARAPRVRLSAERGARRDTDGRRVACVSLVVEDSGAGIPEDVLGRMFNPFFTTRAAGTGLGLAIVHRIVDAHGGAVEVSRGEALGGARVLIHLPEDPARSLEAEGMQEGASEAAVPAGREEDGS